MSIQIILFPLIFIVLFIFYRNNDKHYSLTILDAGFILLLVSEVITTIFSSYLNNSLSSLTRFVVLLFSYIFYKIIFVKFKIRKLFSFLFFFCSSALLILNLNSFLSFYNSIISEGFFELNNFKNLYEPVGMLNNTWASALLLFVPFNIIFLLGRNKLSHKIPVIITLLFNSFCIIVSFSRGVYLSLFIFVLILNLLSIGYFKFKQIILYNVIALLLFSSSAYLVKNSFLTTVSYNKTTSQKRSNSGRIAHWKHIVKLVDDKPVLGYGQKNYGLAREKIQLLEEDLRFSNRTNNTYLQILVERGLLGFSYYLIFFFIVSLIVYRNLKSKKRNKNEKIELIIIFSGLIAFLVREVTFSTLFDSDFIYFLAFYLIFLLVPYDIKITEIWLNKNKKTELLFIGLLLVSVISYLNVKRSLLISYNNKFVESYYENNTQKSLELIDRALKLSADDVDLNKHKALGLTKNAFSIDISEQNSHLLSIYNIDKDALRLSLNYLHKVLKKSPNDSGTLHNVGWIYFALDNKERAKFYFDKSLELNPFNSGFHISSVFYNIKYSNFKDASINFSKALRYSPDILESKFYLEFSKKYSLIASTAEQLAVNGIKKQLETENNLILKARLARLLLNTKPAESMQLLEEVTDSLPNLYRPWMNLAYLYNNVGDSLKAKEYFGKAIFVNKGDFLTQLYFGKYYMSKGLNEEAIVLLKKALQTYELGRTTFSNLNSSIKNLDKIPSSILLSDLQYYLKPYVNASEIFKYFENYYATQNHSEIEEYYKELSVKYKNKLYTCEEDIR